MGLFNRIFSKKIRKGLYHYRATGEWEGLRLHLRVENDGRGVLVVNASRVLFLNESATEYVYLFMKGMSEEEAVKEIQRIYKVDYETAFNDYKDVLFIVNTFAKTSDVCPISFLGVEKIEPFSEELSSPYRMDLALTYRCNNLCIHCYSGGPRVTPELTTQQWMKTIDKILEIGIPHITFTGGEPTLREDLPLLIRYAEEKGLVTGLITNGRRLKDSEYIDELISAGIDHFQITLESYREEVHDKITGVKGSWKETVQGLKNAIATPVYTITNTTLNKHNIEDIIETINFVHNLGLNQFACNGFIYSEKAPETSKDFSIEETELEEKLVKIRDYAITLGMDFIWYTPTQYCKFNPLNLELGIKTCSACRINMCIEPNGDVIPCQSYYKQLGNILTDNWDSIWNNPTCTDLRERKHLPEKCEGCPEIQVCGGGCPLQLQKNGYIC
jgi:radical SAM protein with 4Fe4S-binding SPASM domain